MHGPAAEAPAQWVGSGNQQGCGERGTTAAANPEGRAAVAGSLLRPNQRGIAAIPGAVFCRAAAPNTRVAFFAMRSGRNANHGGAGQPTDE